MSGQPDDPDYELEVPVIPRDGRLNDSDDERPRETRKVCTFAPNELSDRSVVIRSQMQRFLSIMLPKEKAIFPHNHLYAFICC